MDSINRFVRKVCPSGAVILTITLVVISVLVSGKRMAHANTDADELAEMEMRMDQLNYPKWPSLFEVDDQQGNPIFQVVSTDFYSAASVIDSGLHEMVSMNANAQGGYFSVLTSNGGTKARLGIDKTWSGLSISERATVSVSDKTGTHDKISDVAQVQLGGYKGQNYSLKFPGNVGLVAAIGESKAGSGAIIIGDSSGKKRVSMLVGSDNKGMIGIFNADGTAIAVLGEAVGNSGGELVLGSAKGDPRVKMGSNDNRYGVVEALPKGFPYVPKSGLPGSFMLGCPGGDGCYP